MKFKPKLLLIITLLLAFFIRFWKFEYIPFQNDADELAHVFAGQSLLKEGQPISWTSLLVYDDQGTNKYGHVKLGKESLNTLETFQFIQPWFDHPPLVAYVQGVWTNIFGYDFPSIPPSIIFRLPFVTLACFSIYLIFLITKKLFGFYPGLLSLILAGFSPAFIIGQRMAIGENLYTFFILISVNLIISQKKLTKKTLISLIILAVLSGLTKITGLIIIPIVVFFLFLQKQYKKALIYATTSLIIFTLLYLWYGYSIDWTYFIRIFKAQSFRMLGWSNPAYILSQPGFHTRPMFDFSYYLLLILGFIPVFINKGKASRWLLFSLISLMFVIWVTGNEHTMLGWHKLPLFTFLAISSGAVFNYVAKMPLVILIAMTILNNFGLLRFDINQLPDPKILRLIVSGVFGTLFIILLLKQKTIKKISTNLLVITLTIYIISSIYILDQYYEITCKHKVCPLPEITSTQLIKNLVK